MVALGVALPACSGGGGGSNGLSPVPSVSPSAASSASPKASSSPTGGPTATPTATQTGGATASPTPTATPTASGAPTAAATGFQSFGVQQPGAMITGSVQLPAGTNLDVTTLTVANSFGTSTIAASGVGTTARLSRGVATVARGVRRRDANPLPMSGTFTVGTYSTDAQYAAVNNGAGSPLLIGFLSPSEPTLNAHTTAEVSLYLASFAYVLDDANRAAVYASIANTPGFSTVENAIVTALQTNPTVSPASDPGVKAAIASIVGASGSSSAMHLPIARGLAYLRGTSARHRFDAVFSPGTTASGITLVPDTGDEYHIQNTYRRSAIAFIDQVSHVDASGATIVDQAPDTNAPIEIHPTHALGSLLGALADGISHNYAFTPTQTEPFPLKGVAMAKSTLYRIAIVGPGLLSGDYAQLTQAEQDAEFKEAISFAFTDVVFPLLATAIVPFAKIDSLVAGGHAAHEAVKGLVTTILTSVAALQELSAANAEGKEEEVIKTTLGFVVGNVSLRTAAVEALGTILAAGGFRILSNASTQILSDVVLEPLLIFDAGVGVLDVAIVAYDSAHSDRGDIFMAKIPGSLTVLSPNPITITPNSQVSLYAAVHPPPGTLMYHFTNTAVYGHLTVNDPNVTVPDDFVTSQSQVTYTSGKVGVGKSDTVTVTPILVAAGQPNEELTPATDIVTVKAQALPDFTLSWTASIPPQTRTYGLSGGGTMTTTDTQLSYSFIADAYDITNYIDHITPSSTLLSSGSYAQILPRGDVSQVGGDDYAPNSVDLEIDYPSGVGPLPETVTTIYSGGQVCSGNCSHTAMIGFSLIRFPDGPSRDLVGNAVLKWLGKPQVFGTPNAPITRYFGKRVPNVNRNIVSGSRR